MKLQEKYTYKITEKIHENTIKKCGFIKRKIPEITPEITRNQKGNTRNERVII